MWYRQIFLSQRVALVWHNTPQNMWPDVVSNCDIFCLPIYIVASRCWRWNIYRHRIDIIRRTSNFCRCPKTTVSKGRSTNYHTKCTTQDILSKPNSNKYHPKFLVWLDQDWYNTKTLELRLRNKKKTSFLWLRGLLLACIYESTK